MTVTVIDRDQKGCHLNVWHFDSERKCRIWLLKKAGQGIVRRTFVRQPGMPDAPSQQWLESALAK